LVPLVTDSAPDVIVQFYWKNNAQYEEDTINDMMNSALELDHGALSTTLPTLGYIKVKFPKEARFVARGEARFKD
jgi:hypothetical protein